MPELAGVGLEGKTVVSRILHEVRASLTDTLVGACGIACTRFQDELMVFLLLLLVDLQCVIGIVDPTACSFQRTDVTIGAPLHHESVCLDALVSLLEAELVVGGVVDPNPARGREASELAHRLAALQRSDSRRWSHVLGLPGHAACRGEWATPTDRTLLEDIAVALCASIRPAELVVGIPLNHGAACCSPALRGAHRIAPIITSHDRLDYAVCDLCRARGSFAFQTENSCRNQ
mmetsp:Transcript_38916/g.99408  ORF Transcript_38916/g.99408 Transcript_38916/m.99408 type:complete len:233 (-) Transcript_38916:32-730(-)